MKWSSWIVRIASLAALQSSWAQPAAAAQADSGKPAEPPAYEDRLIDAGNLAPLPPDAEDASSYNVAGPPRSWRVEGFASSIDQGATTRRENGLVMGGRLDTPDIGAFTFDGTLRNSPGSTNVFTLWQRGLPFDDGWRANNGAGMLNTPAIDLSRQQFRFYLPTFPIAGVATEWLQRGSLQLQASVGEPGLYNGLRVSGFSRLGGSLLTGGAQWTPSADFQAGFQLVDAGNVQTGSETNGPSQSISARTWYGAMAWQDAGIRTQVNVLDSEANDGRHNMGLWMDGEMRQGRFRHNYGAFRFEPNMFWGYTPINSDLLGGYYRINYQSQQWIWAAGLDSVGSVTDHGANGVYATGNLRYQVDHSLGVGGGANLRRSGNDAGALYGFVDKQSAFGTSRLQVDVVSTRGVQRGQQLTVDHGWPTQVGLRLSTSLSLGRETSAEGKRITRSGIAAFGGIDLTNNLTLEGNVRWSVERESTRTVGKYANLSLVWRISPRWSILATYYDNRSETQNFLSIAPLVPLDTLPVVAKDRAIFLTVRYEDRAGTPVAPLGGAPGSGAGIIAGHIFYDANDDGRRAANEAGAANVTVLLDGKFSTRTDADGRFEFPLVASGTHSIAVVPDNLALPYAVSDARREVAVRTR
ncbi:MAG: hypothetical protein ACXWBT_09320 [Usitatibacter sp.]